MDQGSRAAALFISIGQMSVLVRCAQKPGLGDPNRRLSPVTVQNSRTMLLTRVGVDLDALLGNYKKTQNAHMRRVEERSARGVPAPNDGAPDMPPDSLGASQRVGGKETLEKRLAREEMEKQQKEAYASGKKGAMDKYRITDECPNAACQRAGGVQLDITPDGDAECPRCGYTKKNVEEEMQSGETQIVNRQDKNTYEDGNDNRKHTDLLEQEDKNKALYVIGFDDVPSASFDQIWWANNRMNQSMFWADLMGVDFGMEDGFGISTTEIRHVKQLLRQVCIAAAADLASNYNEEEEEEDRESSEDFLLGSPLLWTILLALHVMTLRADGFAVATETQQEIATLQNLHAYMGRFAGAKMKMYRESMASFLTTVKGIDAKQAAARLDRVKNRKAAYYPLGADPDKLQAKIDMLNELLMQTRGNKDGLAAVVLRGERPSLLPEAARRRQVAPREFAISKGKQDTMLVKGDKQRASAYDRWGAVSTPVKPDFSKPGDNKGGKGGGGGKGKGGGGGKGKGGKGKGKGKGKGAQEPASNNAHDSDSSDDDDDDASPAVLMLKNVVRASREEEEKVRKAKEDEAKAKAQAAAQAASNEIENLFNLGDSAGPSSSSGGGDGGGAGASSSSGFEADPALVAMTVEDLETEIAERQSFILTEEAAGNAGAEQVEQARQETIQFQIALEAKKLLAAAGDGDDDDYMDLDSGMFDDDGALGPDESAASEAPEEETPDNEDGEFSNEEAEMVAAVDVLSLDLSPEAYERVQQEQLEALLAKSKRDAEMDEMEREEREAAAARAQEAREAQYKQDGEYDRHKDIRNDVDGFIAGGMLIPTPTVLDGYAGRSGGKNYTSDKQIRQLTLLQVQASANFRRNPITFVKKWQRLQREWRADCAAKLAKYEDADRKKAESRAKREERARERASEAAKEEKRLEAWRKQVADNRAKNILKKKQIDDRRALQGNGPAIDRGRSSDDKTKFTFMRAGKLVVKGGAEGKKRKRPTAKCNKCGARREVDGPVRAGWECADDDFVCQQERKCHLCGRKAMGDGPPPPGWKCEDSGEYDCLPPDEREGKFAKK